jgi:hypothetical protein
VCSVRDENSCVKHQRMFSEQIHECMPESGGCSLYEVCLAYWNYLAIGDHFQRLWAFLMSLREDAGLVVTMPSSALRRIDRFSRNVVSPESWLPYHALSSLRWVTATWLKLERQWCRLIWLIEVGYVGGPYEKWTLVCSLM